MMQDVGPTPDVNTNTDADPDQDSKDEWTQEVDDPMIPLDRYEPVQLESGIGGIKK